MIHIDDLGFNIFESKMSISALHKAIHIKGQSHLKIREPVTLPPNLTLPTFGTTGLSASQIPNVIETNICAHSDVSNMHGGEDNALDRLEYYMLKSDGLKNYLENKPHKTSKLALWLAYGCISPRYIYSKIRQFESTFGINESSRHFTRELVLRDLFRYYSFKFGSRIFYLHGPHSKVSNTYTNKYNVTWKQNWNLFDKWCKGLIRLILFIFNFELYSFIKGETGYPFVDANMKELNETGYINHRGRMTVATFLANDLEIDWRWGAEYFETQLSNLFFISHENK